MNIDTYWIVFFIGVVVGGLAVNAVWEIVSVKEDG
jgi:dolichyl-phosphate-mannose--protein O-mannosyl transferase